MQHHPPPPPPFPVHALHHQQQQPYHHSMQQQLPHAQQQQQALHPHAYGWAQAQQQQQPQLQQQQHLRGSVRGAHNHHHHQQMQQAVYAQPLHAQQQLQQQPWAPRPPPPPPARAAAAASTAHQPPAKRPREQQQQQPRAQAAAASEPARPAASWQDALQAEVLRFAREVAPTPQEHQARQHALRAFGECVATALAPEARMSRGGIQVLAFGSSLSGLALHSSDVDAVIVGFPPPSEPNGGFAPGAKAYVAQLLARVEKEARRRLRPGKVLLVRHARIPVLKLEFGGVALDASINDTGGVAAANFLVTMAGEFPMLAPLSLLLKAVLKEEDLGDVSRGGLGSFSLINMVLAHLMEEERAGGAAEHAGKMLLSFLRRYGKQHGWGVNTHAVAVGEGGIVPRASLVGAAGGPFGSRDRLALKDPLTGREVAGGSHRYADVQRLFGELHDELVDDAAAAAAAAAASGGRGPYPLLDLILDTRSALRRQHDHQQQQQHRGSGGGREREREEHRGSGSGREEDDRRPQHESHKRGWQGVR